MHQIIIKKNNTNIVIIIIKCKFMGVFQQFPGYFGDWVLQGILVFLVTDILLGE